MRIPATARELWSLAGKLRHSNTVIRAGKIFVWCLEKSTGLDQRRYEDEGVPIKHDLQRVRLLQAFHADLDWSNLFFCQNLLREDISCFRPLSITCRTPYDAPLNI